MTITRPVVVPITRPIVQTIIGAGQRGFVPNFVIDAALGNDSNDGSAASPWASLNKINSIALVNGTTKRVLVKTGAYTKASDFISIVAGSGVSNCRMEVRFEEGCSIDGTNYVGTNCIDVLGTVGNYTNTWIFRGSGCTIRDILTPTGNGLGIFNGGTAYFYDFDVRNCVDCSSSHGDGKAVYEDCYFGDATKSPCANIQTTNTIYRRCTFDNSLDTATAGGLLTISNTPTQRFDDCVFLPGTTGIHRAIGTGGTTGASFTFIRCQLGTLARSIGMVTAVGYVCSFSKCFLNLQFDAQLNMTIDKCFAKLSARERAGGTLTLTNNVIVGPATGHTNVIYDFGGSGVAVTIMKDNIFKMGSAWMAIDATNAGLLAANGSQFYNNILNGGAVYDADLVAAAADIQSTLTSDPLIGAANTVLMADYAYGAGSPAIGSGTNGSNRGFGADDVEERHAA